MNKILNVIKEAKYYEAYNLIVFISFSCKKKKLNQTISARKM